MTGYICDINAYISKKGDEIEKGVGASIVFKIDKKTGVATSIMFILTTFIEVVLLDLLKKISYVCETMISDRLGFFYKI